MDEKRLPQDHEGQLTPEPQAVPPVHPVVRDSVPSQAEETHAVTPNQPSMLGIPTEPKPPKKQPSKVWRDFLIALGIMQVLGVASYVYAFRQIAQEAKDGASGMEFVALILLFTLVPAIAIVVIINLIGLPIYLFKRRPRGIGLAFGVVSLVFSVVLISYGVYSYIRSSSDTSSYVDESSRVVFPEWAAEGEVQKEITKDKAIELLRSCDIYYVYYNDQAQEEYGLLRGELSSTGVVVSLVDGDPRGISIADRYISEVVPIARQAKQECDSILKLWHDGSFEQKQPDGTWK